MASVWMMEDVLRHDHKDHATLSATPETGPDHIVVIPVAPIQDVSQFYRWYLPSGLLGLPRSLTRGEGHHMLPRFDLITRSRRLREDIHPPYCATFPCLIPFKWCSELQVNQGEHLREPTDLDSNSRRIVLPGHITWHQLAFEIVFQLQGIRAISTWTIHQDYQPLLFGLFPLLELQGTIGDAGSKLWVVLTSLHQVHGHTRHSGSTSLALTSHPQLHTSLLRPITPRKASLTRAKLAGRNIEHTITPYDGNRTAVGLILHRAAGSHRYENRFFDTAHSLCDAHAGALVAKRDFAGGHPLAHITLHTLLAEVIQIQGPRLLFHLSCSLPPQAIDYIVSDRLVTPLTESVLLIDEFTTNELAQRIQDIAEYAPRLVTTQRSFSPGWAALLGFSSIATTAQGAHLHPNEDPNPSFNPCQTSDQMHMLCNLSLTPTQIVIAFALGYLVVRCCVVYLPQFWRPARHLWPYILQETKHDWWTGLPVLDTQPVLFVMCLATVFTALYSDQWMLLSLWSLCLTGLASWKHRVDVHAWMRAVLCGEHEDWQEHVDFCGLIPGPSICHPAVFIHVLFVRNNGICFIGPLCLAAIFTPAYRCVASILGLQGTPLAIITFSLAGTLQHICRTKQNCLWAHHVVAHGVARLFRPIFTAELISCLTHHRDNCKHIIMQLSLCARWGIVNSVAHPLRTEISSEHLVFKLVAVIGTVTCTHIALQDLLMHVGIKYILDSLLRIECMLVIDAMIYFETVQLFNHLRSVMRSAFLLLQHTIAFRWTILLAMCVAYRIPLANALPGEEHQPVSVVAPLGTQVQTGSIVIFSILLLQALWFLSTQLRPLWKYGYIISHGAKLPQQGNLTEALLEAVRDLFCMLGSNGAFIMLTSFLAIQHVSNWPLWLSTVASSLAACRIARHQHFWNAIAPYDNHLLPPVLDGMYVRRWWVRAYVGAAHSSGCLYTLPCSLLQLCFPLISVLQHYGPPAIWTWLVVTIMLQKAIKFRLSTHLRYLSPHLQIGNLLTVLTFAGAESAAIHVLGIKHHDDKPSVLKSLSVSLLWQVRWGVTADKHHISPWSIASEARLTQVILIAVLLSTNTTGIATMLSDIVLHIGTVSLFRTLIPGHVRNFMDIALRIHSNLMIHKLLSMVAFCFSTMAVALRAAQRCQHHVGSILLFGFTFTVTSRIVSAAEVLPGTPMHSQYASSPERVRTSCHPAHPYLFGMSKFVTFLLAGFNLEGNVGITPLPTKYLEPHRQTPRLWVTSGVEAILQTSPLFTVDGTVWGALLESQNGPLILISPSTLIEVPILHRACQGDRFIADRVCFLEQVACHKLDNALQARSEHFQKAFQCKNATICCVLSNARSNIFRQLSLAPVHLEPPFLPPLNLSDCNAGCAAFSIAATELGLTLCSASNADDISLQVYNHNVTLCSCYLAPLWDPQMFYTLTSSHILTFHLHGGPYSAQRLRNETSSRLVDPLMHILEVIKLARPPIAIIDAPPDIATHLTAITSLRTHSHELKYHLVLNKQEAKQYLPVDKCKCGILLLRHDCVGPVQHKPETPVPWTSPTPATIWHRGVFHKHPTDEHTRVDQDCYQDMSQDNVCRFLHLLLTVPGSRYRDNFHLARPRVGQWLIDKEGQAHWILPSAFLRAMGFPNTFSMPCDDLSAYKVLSKSALPPLAAIWIHHALVAIGAARSAQIQEVLGTMLFRTLPTGFRELCTGSQIQHPLPTAQRVTGEQLAQCTGVSVYVANTMLETRGCELHAAHRILLHLGIHRLHDRQTPATSAFVQGVLAADRKLAINFTRNLDHKQLSLTQALEGIMSQNTQIHTQMHTQNEHMGHSAVTLQLVKCQEFPSLAIITSNDFWTDMLAAHSLKQAKCYSALSTLASLALQLQCARACALTADMHLPMFPQSPRKIGTVVSCLHGATYSTNVQAVTLCALIACFAFQTDNFVCLALCTPQLACKLGLRPSQCRVLF